MKYKLSNFWSSLKRVAVKPIFIAHLIYLRTFWNCTAGKRWTSSTIQIPQLLSDIWFQTVFVLVELFLNWAINQE